MNKNQIINFNQKRHIKQYNITTINNEVIRTETILKYLGKTLDRKLHITEHINDINRKLK